MRQSRVFAGRFHPMYQGDVASNIVWGNGVGTELWDRRPDFSFARGFPWKQRAIQDPGRFFMRGGHGATDVALTHQADTDRGPRSFSSALQLNRLMATTFAIHETIAAHWHGECFESRRFLFVRTPLRSSHPCIAFSLPISPLSFPNTARPCSIEAQRSRRRPSPNTGPARAVASNCGIR